jgi:hypothetical protein
LLVKRPLIKKSVIKSNESKISSFQNEEGIKWIEARNEIEVNSISWEIDSENSMVMKH